MERILAALPSGLLLQSDLIKSKFSNFADVAREKTIVHSSSEKRFLKVSDPHKQKHRHCLSKTDISRDMFLVFTINTPKKTLKKSQSFKDKIEGSARRNFLNTFNALKV